MGTEEVSRGDQSRRFWASQLERDGTVSRWRGGGDGRGDSALTFFWAAMTTRACGWGLDARIA